MLDYLCSLAERHREQLRNPHKPKGETRRSRFPRLLARFNYRERRTLAKGAKS